MIYRIAILGNSGNYVFQITTPQCVWSVGGGWNPIPAQSGYQTDPGQCLYFDGWRLGSQSVKMRQIGITGPSLLMDTDFLVGLQNEIWELWLQIDTGTTAPPVVNLKIYTQQGRGDTRLLCGQQYRLNRCRLVLEMMSIVLFLPRFRLYKFLYNPAISPRVQTESGVSPDPFALSLSREPEMSIARSTRTG
jgi:hypothetical protein